MTNTISLDAKYSTTRLLTKEKPIVENKPEDKFETVLFLPKGEDRKGEGGLRTKGYFKKSYSDKPLISIITVVFNGEKYLEQTIQSVISQTYDNVEYIIIDGGSTDGTLEIIKKHEDQIDYWVSEKDAGIYDAMNKGLKLSMGKVIGIINADDWYVDDAIEKSVMPLLDNGADYTIGKVRKIPSNMIVTPLFPLKSEIYQGMMYPHIGAFISREVYKKIGLFDTEYKVSADFDMAMRIHLQGFKSIYVQQIIGNVLEGGVSADNIAKKENKKIAIKYGRGSVMANIFYVKYRIKAFLFNLLPLSWIKYIKRMNQSRAQYE